MQNLRTIKTFTVAAIMLLASLNVLACRHNTYRESSENIAHSQKISEEIMNSRRLRIVVGDKILIADLADNATTRAFIAKLPLTLPMKDLYDREVVYRFPKPLPSEGERTSGYQVGDISYWSPRHSFVIFYKQNGEVISNLQKVGHIESGVEIFETTGDVSVRFELIEDGNSRNQTNRTLRSIIGGRSLPCRL